jgi:aspartyl-tRNA(Asn)/glutamyl-tRNA(Gln) amidotransferase subunit C
MRWTTSPPELQHILNALRALQQLGTSAIPPTAQVIHPRNVMREDVARPCWPIEGILKNAPATRDGQFLIPSVIE